MIEHHARWIPVGQHTLIKIHRFGVARVQPKRELNINKYTYTHIFINMRVIRIYTT